ncbi:MAG: mechanosensitive ion channel domain-containing protein, partial [Planctomycetota bacterium]
MRYRIFFAIMLGLSFAGVQAQESAVEEVVADTAVLKFHGKDLFEVTNISQLPAESRTDILVKRLKKQAKSPFVSTKEFAVYHDDDLKISMIMSGTDVVCGIWERDAEHHGVPRQQLAEQWLTQIREIIDQYRKDYTAEHYLEGAVLTAIATVVFLIVWLVLRLLCHKEMKIIEKKFAGQQMFKFVEGDSIVTINNNLVRLIHLIVLVGVFILYLDVVLSFFPWMFNFSARLFELISTPFISFGHAFMDNLPNLFALLAIILIVRYLLRFIKHVFTQIGEGKVRIRGFYKDWADTTYSLVRIVIIVFAAVAAFPYIPGSNSPAFKGISIFMGVLFSLGSTSTVGNIFGGLMLTYMRSFSPGDFVEINGLSGTVMARRTFSTRLKTPTNEIISIPNALVSANHIINYSRMTKSIGVNLGTAVTIGYDVPWRKVHELLLQSAQDVEEVLEDPTPTILQLSLDDFYVKYKLI